MLPPEHLEPQHLIAARLGLGGGYQVTQQGWNVDDSSNVGFSGGLGLYLGHQWGLMVGGLYAPMYPNAYLVDGEVFTSNRWIWSSVGMGWGDYRLPFGGTRGNGLAFTGNLFFKLEQHWGLGFQLATATRNTYYGGDSYFLGQLAFSWLY
jgi:hypothetical protein